MITFRDLGDQIWVEHDLKRLASMPDENPNPLVERNAEGSLIYSNQSMTELMGQYGFNDNAMPTILPPHILTLARESITSGYSLRELHVTETGRHYE